LGTSVRFPSLYTYNHGHSLKNKESLKAETGKSIDIGIDKFFPDNDINLNVTAFFLEYKDDIKGWASHGGGRQYTYSGEDGEFVLDNSSSKTESYGFELQSDWKLNDAYALGIGYTRTESHDGTTCDNPDATGGPGSAACNDTMNVRVPRHQINFSGSKILDNLTQTFKLKYVGERRDYGNINQSFQDVILSNYFTADYNLNYKIFNTYNFNFSAKNIFDKRYSEAYEYKAPGRSFNFMLNKNF
jgi:outer membrane receptor protein involved in Fe transport